MFEILLNLSFISVIRGYSFALTILLHVFPAFSSAYWMDTRKARDPRLAQRADPRLQVPPPPSATSSNPPSENLPIQWTYATGDEPQHGFQQSESHAATSSVTPYRERPLFCVVCASNQASG